MTSLAQDLPGLMRGLRGRLTFDQPLAATTWFRVGGTAEAMFSPADEEDLAAFLQQLPREIPVSTIGLASNMIIRDGGVPGVTLRMGGRAFGAIVQENGERLRAGAAAPDMRVAKAAAEAGIEGLAFYRGIPGSIGGALRMNAGAHGGETTDVLVEAGGFDRAGNKVRFSHDEMGFSYRHCSVDEAIIFTSALFQGRLGERAAIEADMARITATREAAQPIREKTGGSTFRNPAGGKAWQLIDRAGCRGLVMGDAQVSEMHCNFLINRGHATAADIEALGEEVRRRVMEQSGVMLHWEIKRVGVAR